MDEEEMLDYTIFKKRRNPSQVWVQKRRVVGVRDMYGPWRVVEGQVAVGDCVVLCADREGRQAYGWIHDVDEVNHMITIKYYPPALTAFKEALCETASAT